MNNNTFKGLSDLSKGIKEKIDLIDNGKYGLVDLEKALGELNELNQRLVVLKYKAIEQLAQESKVPVNETPNEFEETPIQEEVNINESGTSNPGQMTIMDGIKEVAKESVLDKFPSEQTSLADQLISEEKTLAEKMENSAITDLKSVISINQRFSFIRELFGDDGAAFDMSIDGIQKSTSLKEAEVIIEKLRVERNWNGEDDMVMEFEELVKRRFSA
ncbi:MAG: hypothetical protein HKN39_07755 [Flavobacteriales bacterium]|nr:hypothetical protein [Flavobacteriales bacterium]